MAQRKGFFTPVMGFWLREMRVQARPGQDVGLGFRATASTRPEDNRTAAERRARFANVRNSGRYGNTLRIPGRHCLTEGCQEHCAPNCLRFPRSTGVPPVPEASMHGQDARATIADIPVHWSSRGDTGTGRLPWQSPPGGESPYSGVTPSAIVNFVLQPPHRNSRAPKAGCSARPQSSIEIHRLKGSAQGCD